MPFHPGLSGGRPELHPALHPAFRFPPDHPFSAPPSVLLARTPHLPERAVPSTPPPPAAPTPPPPSQSLLDRSARRRHEMEGQASAELWAVVTAAMQVLTARQLTLREEARDDEAMIDLETNLRTLLWAARTYASSREGPAAPAEDDHEWVDDHDDHDDHDGHDDHDDAAWESVSAREASPANSPSLEQQRRGGEGDGCARDGTQGDSNNNTVLLHGLPHYLVFNGRGAAGATRNPDCSTHLAWYPVPARGFEPGP